MSELGPPKTERASVFLVYAYRKPTAVQQRSKMSEDINKLITPAQAGIATVKIIRSFNDKPQKLIGQTDYVTVRDFLMNSISMSNAIFSGAASLTYTA